MRQQILDKIEESFKRAENYYGRSFSRPKNVIFKRSGTKGGHCNYSKSELMFQLDFAEAYPEDYLKETVPHEVAHWIDRELYGYTRHNGRRVMHGRTWKNIMIRCYGLSPERCHEYDVSVTKTKSQTRYSYKCGCRKHSISQTVHNRILTGRNYRCSLCRQTIVAHVPTREEQIENFQREIDKLKQRISNNGN